MKYVDANSGSCQNRQKNVVKQVNGNLTLPCFTIGSPTAIHIQTHNINKHIQIRFHRKRPNKK